jgi:hypothetical protein
MVVKTSVADGMATANPRAAASVAADDPRIALTIAMNEFRTGRGVVSEAAKRNVRAAALKAPLAEEPFLLAAVDAIVQKDARRGEQLLVAARNRDPRSDWTRLLLLDRYIRRSDIIAVTKEMGALSGIAPAASGVLIGELARMAQSPETVGPLEAALRKHPRFRDDLLQHLADKNADPDLILRVARNVPARAGASGPAPWQVKLVTSLAERGQIQRAYQLWRTFFVPRAPEKKSGVYDGNFRGLAGGAPFGWHFPASPAGLAERTAAGTLQVDYYGRDPADLATQLLMLPPGEHRLTVRAGGEAEGEGSKLSWKVQCQPSKAEVADLVFRKLTYAPKVMAVNFTIPASGCSAQWLRLIGTAGEFPKAQNATISTVQISAAG